MMLTRVFKSGNSLAVRIPKELAFLDPSEEVEIERIGDTLVLRPAGQQTLEDLPAILAAFSPDFMAEGREFNEQRERDWRGEAALAEPVPTDYVRTPEAPSSQDRG